MIPEQPHKRPHPDPLPPGTPDRLRFEFNFYDRGSRRHLSRFQFWKTLQIFAGAAIPICAVVIPGDHITLLRGVTASLGGFIAGSESYLQFRQYHQNWVRWRTAAEALRREAFLFAQSAGPYRGSENPQILLAENVEDILAIEQRSWRSLQDNPHPAKNTGGAAGN